MRLEPTPSSPFMAMWLTFFLIFFTRVIFYFIIFLGSWNNTTLYLKEKICTRKKIEAMLKRQYKLKIGKEGKRNKENIY